MWLRETGAVLMLVFTPRFLFSLIELSGLESEALEQGACLLPELRVPGRLFPAFWPWWQDWSCPLSSPSPHPPHASS